MSESARHTLVLIRHGKSDWSTGLPDRERPLAARGERQAPGTGRYLAHHGPIPDLALVSPAVRARRTWELVAAELPDPIPVRVEEGIYGGGAGVVEDLVRALPESVRVAAVVGHNPTLEEVVAALTGSWQPMPTSAIAVIDLEVAWAEAGDQPARLLASGRP